MIARSVFWGILFFCLSKTQGSLGVISGQFCMINHAPEKARKKKSHLLSVHWEFTLKEIKGDRQRDERIDIFSSPFGSLWEEENYFKAAALMKVKGVMPDVFLQRWNQQYEWLKGREGGRKRTFVCKNLMGDFGEERECYLTAVNKTAIPLSGDATGSTLSTVISGVCIKKCSRCHQIVSSFAASCLGILSDWAPARCLSLNVMVSYSAWALFFSGQV